MPRLPNPIRAVSFFDGQNLFHCAKAAFGYTYPNYDPVALAQAVCASQGWQSEQVRFYTGVPMPPTTHSGIISGLRRGRRWVAKASMCSHGRCVTATGK